MAVWMNQAKTLTAVTLNHGNRIRLPGRDQEMSSELDRVSAEEVYLVFTVAATIRKSRDEVT